MNVLFYIILTVMGLVALAAGWHLVDFIRSLY